MSKGMKSGEWSGAASQNFESSTPGTGIWVSDTIKHATMGMSTGYDAVKQDDGSVGLSKFHN